jgi:hypothetical protein
MEPVLQNHQRSDDGGLFFKRLQVIRFPLIVSVVFFHSFVNSTTFADGTILHAPGISPWVIKLEDAISNGLGGIRMPTFFIIGGYLFASGITSDRKYISKLKSRFNSIAVPLITWNIMMLIIIGLAQNIPATRNYFSGNTRWSLPIADLGLRGYLDCILGIDGLPLVYPLWFLRDFFFMCLATPIFFSTPNNWRIMACAVLFTCWFLNIWPYHVPTSTAAAFFPIGVVLAMNNKNLFLLDRFGPTVTTSFIALTLIRSINTNEQIKQYISSLYCVAGILTALYCSKLILKLPRLTGALVRLSVPSFFIFLAHEPLLTAIRKVSFVVLRPSTDAAVLSIYFSSVAATIAILLVTYAVLRRFTPQTLSFLTGGRAAS